MSKLGLSDKQITAIWLAAGGRCQFRGCLKSVGCGQLTHYEVDIDERAQHMAGHGAHAHGHVRHEIDPAHVMLLCDDHHRLIDTPAYQALFPSVVLMDMKREQLAMIECIMSAHAATRSVPVMVEGAMGVHSAIDARQVRLAMMRNSAYALVPTDHSINMALGDAQRLAERDPQAGFAAARRVIGRHVVDLHRYADEHDVHHMTLCGTAPAAFLFYFGYLVGEREQASVLNARLADGGTCFEWNEIDDGCRFDAVIPSSLAGKVVAIALALSTDVAESEVASALPAVPILHLRASVPGAGCVDSPRKLEACWQAWRKLLDALDADTTLTVHLFARVPPAAAIELGRHLRPHEHHEIVVWGDDHGEFRRYGPLEG